MEADGAKDWKQLCREAAAEGDPKKLLEIITELEKALDERKDRLRGEVLKSA